MSELWKPIPGYEGWYEVSNFGRVRSIDRIEYQKHREGGQSKYLHKGQLIKPQVAPNGYIRVDLHKNGTFRRYLLHRLVCSAFLEQPVGKNYVNHLDNDPSNNNVTNLEWCTQSENIQYAYDNKTKTPPNERKIGQYSTNGSFIKVWDSMAAVERDLHIWAANIHKVCTGKRRTAGGYEWRYIE